MLQSNGWPNKIRENTWKQVSVANCQRLYISFHSETAIRTFLFIYSANTKYIQNVENIIRGVGRNFLIPLCKLQVLNMSKQVNCLKISFIALKEDWKKYIWFLFSFWTVNFQHQGGLLHLQIIYSECTHTQKLFHSVQYFWEKNK